METEDMEGRSERAEGFYSGSGSARASARGVLVLVFR
jgi:hypothetical protein